jgi:hypothetical protein
MKLPLSYVVYRRAVWKSNSHGTKLKAGRQSLVEGHRARHPFQRNFIAAKLPTSKGLLL